MYGSDYDDLIASYYDAGYATLEHLGLDVAFYRQLASEAGGPVLELGCGTGRALLEVVQAGQSVTGLDSSPAMLEVARGSVPPSVRLVRADMRDFDLDDTRFALIFSAFRAFQHLETVEDQLRCLACARRHLAPGGMLAFDVFHPSLERMALDEEPETEDLRFAFEGDEVVRYARVVRDRATQSMDICFRWVRNRDGAVIADDETSFRMRYFFRYELEHLLARAGFEAEIFGDFDRSAVGRDSPSFVVVARSRA